MKFPFRLSCAILASLLFLAGCAQQEGGNVFTVRQIDSSQDGNGTVRVKLTTAGNLAEADESLLVAYVKIVAVHEATRQQQRLAAARAKAIYRQMAARRQPGKTRYLAVSTEVSASPKNRKIAASVMIWDTQSESIVGTSVYDLESRLVTGHVAQFETYSAEYVGSGH